MTEEQLQQLIKDEDISPGFLDESYPQQFSNYSITSSDGLIHSVSRDIHEIVRECYYEHLNNLYCKDAIEFGFKIIINDRLNYYPQSKERQIKLLEDLIEEKARVKDAMELIDAAVSECEFVLKDSYCNLLGSIIAESENMWFWKIYDDNGLKLLEILKFEIFKGRKIEFTSDINIEEIARFFEQLGEEVFEEVFKNILVLKKIEYLKQRLADIQNKKETHFYNLEKVSVQKETHLNNQIETVEQDLPEFKNIFLKPDYFILATDVLLELEILNNDGTSLVNAKKLQGIIRLWYTILREHYYFKLINGQYLSDRAVAKVLNKHFNQIGYQLFSEKSEGKTFRSQTSVHAKNYENELRNMLPKVNAKS